MPFFILIIDQALDTNTIDTLNYLMASYPNGTYLDRMQRIMSPELNGWVRIYWLEDKLVLDKVLNSIRSMQGITSFEQLDGIPITIHSASWQFDNVFINNMFLPIIAEYEKKFLKDSG